MNAKVVDPAECWVNLLLNLPLGVSTLQVPVGKVLKVVNQGKGFGQMHVIVDYNIPVNINKKCDFNISVEVKTSEDARYLFNFLYQFLLCHLFESLKTMLHLPVIFMELMQDRECSEQIKNIYWHALGKEFFHVRDMTGHWITEEYGWQMCKWILKKFLMLQINKQLMYLFFYPTITLLLFCKKKLQLI